MTTDATDPRALGEEIARIQQTFDDANAANDDAAWEAARTYLVAWFAIHGGSKTILDALRHRFASPQTAIEVLCDEAADTIASLTAERDAALERCEVMRGALERCARIVERNLYHQSEKVEDVTHIARAALGSGGGG